MAAQIKWQYMAIPGTSRQALQEPLEDAGENGWELVTVVVFHKSIDSPVEFVAYLKRPA